VELLAIPFFPIFRETRFAYTWLSPFPQRTAMSEIKPRYEFRVWSETLAPIREKLNRLAEPREMVSEETYLISAITDRCNAKIRAGLMDIKVLVDEDRGLEQWNPVLKAGFPLLSSAITTQVFPSLQIPVQVLAKAAYTLDEFLDDVMRAEPAISIVDVSKTRYQFGIGACAAEYAQTSLAGVPRDTAAVESVDPGAVLQLVRELGLRGANTSYIREIKRVLGLADRSPVSP
jgi:exopolyphosphatase / guanosine-5'-triphosphate,3'-diphosphate pyrophosphatase